MLQHDGKAEVDVLLTDLHYPHAGSSSGTGTALAARIVSAGLCEDTGGE